MTRATGGLGRLRMMWESGVFAHLGSLLDHTIIDVASVEGRDVVVMRDATDDLVPAVGPVSRETSRLLLGGLAVMHDGCREVSLPQSCPIAARYGMFAPSAMAADAEAPGSHPSTPFILRGWELFAEHVDRDIVEATFHVHRDPARLGERLGAFASTLLHGDAKLMNLGLSPRGLVAIDWGDITGLGPREVDVAWYALKGCDRIGCTPGDVFADYEDASGARLEPEALDLVCIGSMAQMGFWFGNAVFGPDPQRAAIVNPLLDWWVGRVRAALERI